MNVYVFSFVLCSFPLRSIIWGKLHTNENCTKTINPNRTKMPCENARKEWIFRLIIIFVILFFFPCQRYNGHISQFGAYVSNWIYSCVISNEFYFDVWIYAWNCIIVIRKCDCGLDSPPPPIIIQSGFSARIRNCFSEVCVSVSVSDNRLRSHSLTSTCSDVSACCGFHH